MANIEMVALTNYEIQLLILISTMSSNFFFRGEYVTHNKAALLSYTLAILESI